MQGCAKKIKGIIRIRKNDADRNNFMVRGTSLKDHIGRVRKRNEMIFSRMIYHNIKVLLLYLVKY